MSIFNKFVYSVAAIALFVATLVSCQKQETQGTGSHSLTVTPSGMLEFAAMHNDDAVLSVETDADSWDFELSTDWIIASKSGNSLSVNVKDNTELKERYGRITVKAEGAGDVKINVHQAAGSADIAQGSFVCTDASTNLVLNVPELTTTTSVKFRLSRSVTEDVVLSVSFDGSYLDEYNYINKDSHSLMPQANISFSGELRIPAGETESNAIIVSMDASSLDFLTAYLVPLKAKLLSGNIAMAQDRVNLVLVKQNIRRNKNLVIFEVNDTNPLNALEFKLADGQYFFDAVVLFAANINYNAKEDLVYLYNNKNVQALLDGSETFLQPIRKAGIKVYLGLLGNHDQAGLCQLSDWGAQQYAKDVAQACKKFKLDGVLLDDEWSTNPDLSNPWFTKWSEVAGARLCYELKKEMRKACAWPTEVSYYELGGLDNLPSVKDLDTKEEHTPAEFVDFYVANYYDTDNPEAFPGSSAPYADFTYANCSFNSYECNVWRGKAVTEDSARQAKANGYGWCMWFALDHSGSGNINRNFNARVRQYMQATARGFYDSELLDPAYVYHKSGDGVFDPVRHESKANYN